jgi:segregation and condensation protein A
MLGGDDGTADDGGEEAETEAGDAAVDRPKPPGEEDEDDVQPVEVLVQLAKDGEIEPWDIDIVTVTDKFLDRLDEADLRTSGRALFYASVLLRMKSDAMLNDDEDEEPEPEPWEAAAMGEDTPIDPEADPFASLEQEMDRRLERKRARGMPQTLDELVRDLREAERDTWWKESREYDTSDSPGTYQRGTQELDYRSGDEFRMDDEPTAADVTGTAHGEDIDTIIDDVYGACLEQWEAGREEVLYAEIEDAGGSRVETFLGLLFLSHRGQVYLQQDELFGDLWIQDPNAAQGSEEAIAD